LLTEMSEALEFSVAGVEEGIVASGVGAADDG
jgi:hypothetical protein